MHLKPVSSLCDRLGLVALVPDARSKLGLAMGTLGQLPIHGLRLPPDGETNGWYLWCGGEPSEAADFYSPLHVLHIGDYLPQVREYLVLPPGYRFIVDGKGYEDIWFDGSLLEPEPQPRS